MQNKFKIIFLNHASFIIQFNNSKILVDPYLFGEAFNNGWNLLKEFNHNEHLQNITHICYSHEHPDHFSVPFLKSIKESERKNITIIYQQTYDKKVKKFCEKLGFKFREFKDSFEEKIADSFFITIGKVPFFDSWINFNVDNKNILNVNDCVLENPNLVFSIKKKLNRKINCLFTQFSYAEFIEQDQQKFRATKQLEKIKLQDEILKPEYIVPFASFIYYSHEENKFMNKNFNKLNDVHEFIDNNCNAIPIILKPNEVWQFDKKNNQDSVNFWNNIYEKVEVSKFHQLQKKFNENQLIEKSRLYLKKINSLNNKFLIILLTKLNFFPTIKIYLTDLDKFFKFNVSDGLTEVDLEKNENYLKISSDSLAFIFDFDFGYDTLLVNARLSTSQKYLTLINRCFLIGTLNNTGRYIKFIEFFKYLNLGLVFRGLEVAGLKKRKY